MRVQAVEGAGQVRSTLTEMARQNGKLEMMSVRPINRDPSSRELWSNLSTRDSILAYRPWLRHCPADSLSSAALHMRDTVPRRLPIVNPGLARLVSFKRKGREVEMENLAFYLMSVGRYFSCPLSTANQQLDYQALC